MPNSQKTQIIDMPTGCRCWVACITDLHKTYKLDREFLKGAEREKRRRDGQEPETRYSFKLSDGLYEIQDAKGRRYLAVLNRRLVPIDASDLEFVAETCREYSYSFPRLLTEWMSLPRGRTSGRLRELVEKRTADAQAAAQAAAKDRATAAKRRQAEERESRRRKLEAATAQTVFDSSDGALVRGYLRKLEQSGVEGTIAAQLFRCQKASTRAKVYRGDYKGLSYERKQDALSVLCGLLKGAARFTYGWKEDPLQPHAPWVLYVDLPEGQVSFHSLDRGGGPDYQREWDGEHVSTSRILAYCDRVLLTSEARSGESR